MATALVVASSFSLSTGRDPLGPEKLVGKAAPALKVTQWLNTGGKALSLDKLKGKVVVIDFWAFW